MKDVIERAVNRKLGARVRQVRKLRGLTQVQLSKACRAESSVVQHYYESGKRAISIYRLLQLSEILQVVPSAWLLSDDGWDYLIGKMFAGTQTALVPPQNT